ncbi:acyl carrier protein [Lysinibacillus antri]|uniref:Acyl carrier protein n=1 Tax=Lysinibacillus antri TaxID=2498145 RepID=A0A3S0P4Y5_9BACI|nr:acyl carrier protein [Lysinibacillus antri]RUL54199.1 acyl carrier protein [Lysinibacillus antri]
MNDGLKQQINEIIAEILEMNANDTSIFDRGKNTNWDSLKHLEIIMAIEEELDIRFSSSEVSEIMNAEDIYNYVDKKLNE